VTCSTDAREDEEIVDAFLADHEEFVPSAVRWPGMEATAIRLRDYALSIPGLGGADGFFYAKLERKSG